MARNILSMCMSGHGLSAAVCLEGKIVAAVNLERLTRIKNDILLPISRQDLKSFGWNGDPESYRKSIDLPFDFDNDYSSVDFQKNENWNRLIDYVLGIAGIDLRQIECVAYSYRHTESARNFFKSVNPKIDFVTPEHHFSHACQAYLASPFDDAAILVVDGQGVPLDRTGGDQLCGCMAVGKGNSIDVLEEFPVRYSLGGMYAEFTKKVGLKTNEECKTMGLASYGTPKIYSDFSELMKFGVSEYNLRDIAGLLKNKGMPQSYTYSLGKYATLLGRYEDRKQKGEFSQLYMDIAYAGQKITEDVLIFLANRLHEKTGSKNLCIAGGVGLNCVANYQVLAHSPFENIFIHPNAGDNGLAVGQALYVHNILDGNTRTYVVTHDYLGKSYNETDIDHAVAEHASKAAIDIRKYDDNASQYRDMAAHIADGKITSWYQGRSEFGPRALGNRSILADPRREDMKDILNHRVKFRESFRPFTPSVLKERAAEYFTLSIESPFMLLAPYVKSGMAEKVPAITHVDNTARVQTVTRESNERYYDLISEFDRQTGVPVVLNTSFNVAGEPIVETPADALRCFLSTDIDVLGIGGYILQKRKG